MSTKHSNVCFTSIHIESVATKHASLLALANVPNRLLDIHNSLVLALVQSKVYPLGAHTKPILKIIL